MEIKNQTPAWLDESHPNYLRWQRSRDLSIERGKFVKSIVDLKVQTKNLTILDLGSGEGGTAKVFSENNFVISLDLSFVRLRRQSESNFDFQKINGSALIIPFANYSFDLVIIQDVIEHLENPNDFYSEVKRVLKKNGVIYLSTPNKFSIVNIFSDPHFGLPMISILRRESVKKYFLKYFRKEDYKRNDIAQLFSLNELVNLFHKDFELSLHTKFSVRELFNGNKAIVWSNFHLKLVGLCKSIKLNWLLKKIANDNFGILNKYFTPTFYITLKKKC